MSTDDLLGRDTDNLVRRERRCGAEFMAGWRKVD
jgi:hypothetical protein